MKVRATVAYDGSGFHGFAVNPGVRTVAGEIEHALTTIATEPVTIACAGRTDKGVHGHGQVISFEVPDRFEPQRLQQSVNHLCRPSIIVRDVERAPDDFHARFSAKWRLYRYRVAGPVRDPLEYGRVWHLAEPLDVEAMNRAVTHLAGVHDFSSFCRRPKVDEGEPEVSLVREVLDAEWSEDPPISTLWIRATSFCHQMVRSIVGTSVDVGRGRLDADDVVSILAARDRTVARPIAPPEGLTLWEVGS